MALSKISFKDFLLNENKFYLGQRIGDVLTSLHDLQQNSEGMGRRQVTANAERIVDQIRSVLHSTWSKKEEKYLKDIQKAGAAIARSIEEKGDLEEILPSVTNELEQVASKLGTPANSLATPPGGEEPETEEPGENMADPQGQQEQPPEQQQPPQEQPPMQPQAQPQGMPQPMPQQGMGMPPMPGQPDMLQSGQPPQM
ncbi:MAG: hypothetical protein DWQ19_11560 [Crenarchaeota archaeon]|nr:MAG: hypothetical protein DWQ19_11560 [Thermoproteota archaeon]